MLKIMHIYSIEKPESTNIQNMRFGKRLIKYNKKKHTREAMQAPIIYFKTNDENNQFENYFDGHFGSVDVKIDSMKDHSTIENSVENSNSRSNYLEPVLRTKRVNNKPQVTDMKLYKKKQETGIFCQFIICVFI